MFSGFSPKTKLVWTVIASLLAFHLVNRVMTPSFESSREKGTTVTGQATNQQSPAGNDLHYKKGEFQKLKTLPAGKNLNVAKLNGAFDERSNDLMELCKDWLYYRGKILKYARVGDNSAAAKARAIFNEVNASLAEYDENDVAHMTSLIEASGYKPPL